MKILMQLYCFASGVLYPLLSLSLLFILLLGIRNVKEQYKISIRVIILSFLINLIYQAFSFLSYCWNMDISLGGKTALAYGIIACAYISMVMQVIGFFMLFSNMRQRARG